jgi:hypothetical protein
VANVIGIEHGRKARQLASQFLQVAQLPTLPLREAIVDAWLDEQPINGIAARFRISGATVQAVIRSWCEIWHRQAVVSRIEAPGWLRERHAEIETEVWSEFRYGREAA